MKGYFSISINASYNSQKRTIITTLRVTQISFTNGQRHLGFDDVIRLHLLFQDNGSESEWLFLRKCFTYVRQFYCWWIMSNRTDKNVIRGKTAFGHRKIYLLGKDMYIHCITLVYNWVIRCICIIYSDIHILSIRIEDYHFQSYYKFMFKNKCWRQLPPKLKTIRNVCNVLTVLTLSHPEALP